MLESPDNIRTDCWFRHSGCFFTPPVFTGPQTDQQASPPRIIALTGFMGAGKTSVGRALAALFGWTFVDLDQEVELRQKLRIRDIFELHGELHFRKIETDTLRTILEQASAPMVIALGGGTFIPAGNSELLRNFGACVVFLDTPMAQLLLRCGVEAQPSQNPRPLAADRDAFRELYAQRLPQYGGADLTVSTAGKTIEENAREIASSLGLAAGAR